MRKYRVVERKSGAFVIEEQYGTNISYWSPLCQTVVWEGHNGYTGRTVKYPNLEIASLVAHRLMEETNIKILVYVDDNDQYVRHQYTCNIGDEFMKFNTFFKAKKEYDRYLESFEPKSIYYINDELEEVEDEVEKSSISKTDIAIIVLSAITSVYIITSIFVDCICHPLLIIMCMVINGFILGYITGEKGHEQDKANK